MKKFMIVACLIALSILSFGQDTLKTTIYRSGRSAGYNHLTLNDDGDTINYRPPIYTYTLEVDKNYISGVYLERAAHNFTTSIVLGIVGVGFAMVPVMFPNFNTDTDAWYATGAGLGVAGFGFYCHGIHLIHKSGLILRENASKKYKIEITGNGIKFKF